MKKILSLVVASAFSLGLLFTTGCKTTSSNTPNINTAAAVLKLGVTVGLNEVITKNPTNAPPYIVLARDTLNTVIGGTNYTPGALSAAINQLPPQALGKPEVKRVVYYVTTTYDSFFSLYVQDQVNGATNAVILLTAVRDGCNAALAMASPTA